MQRQELIIAQLAKSGIRIKLTPTTPQQAMQRLMIEKKGDMLISPTGGYPDPSQSYEVQFAKDALRNAGKIEVPGFRELMDATEEAQDQATRKAAFAKLQRFVIEQAMQVPQYICAGRHGDVAEGAEFRRRHHRHAEIPGSMAGGIATAE